MLRSFPIAQEQRLPIRLVGIGVFVMLTAVAAQISIPLEPVPFTMQVLVVLLSGMVLGWRDGFLSQVTYVGLIAVGFPIAAEGMGSAALMGPTAGYLFSFAVAAGVVGFLVERAGTRLWQRWLAGLAGVVVIYIFGATYLAIFLHKDVAFAWTVGVQPFIVLDTIKAFLGGGLGRNSTLFHAEIAVVTRF